MTPRCLGCDTPLTDPGAAFDGGCASCVGAVWAAVLRLRDGPADVVGARVAWLRDQEGAGVIADVIIGQIPFNAELLRDHE